jgi:hypothetical protein
LLISSKSQTLGAFLDDWLLRSLKPRAKARAFESFSTIVKLQVKPTLGAVALHKLNPQHVQGLLNEKSRSCRRRPSGISRRSSEAPSLKRLSGDWFRATARPLWTLHESRAGRWCRSMQRRPIVCSKRPAVADTRRSMNWRSSSGCGVASSWACDGLRRPRRPDSPRGAVDATHRYRLGRQRQENCSGHDRG